MVSRTYVNSLVAKVTNINQRQYTTISRKLLTMPGPPRAISFNPQIQVFHLKPSLPGHLSYQPTRRPTRNLLKNNPSSASLRKPVTRHNKTKSLNLQKSTSVYNGQKEGKVNNI